MLLDSQENGNEEPHHLVPQSGDAAGGALAGTSRPVRANRCTFRASKRLQGSIPQDPVRRDDPPETLVRGVLFETQVFGRYARVEKFSECIPESYLQ